MKGTACGRQAQSSLGARQAASSNSNCGHEAPGSQCWVVSVVQLTLRATHQKGLLGPHEPPTTGEEGA